GGIQIMLSSPQGVSVINPGDRIAQLVLLPSAAQYTKAIPQTRGNRGFGSSGVGPMIFWSMDCTDRPTKTLTVEGIPIRGLLDTGADTSIITQQDWPRKWPVQRSDTCLRGLGYSEGPNKSSQVLKWKDEEGHSGTFQPYVLTSLPITLWGRDILAQLNLKLVTLPDPPPLCWMKQ
ncbi:endogenous retrovirus group K member 7 Pro protein-like protein, partial [Leptotrombidium deliense]